MDRFGFLKICSQYLFKVISDSLFLICVIRNGLNFPALCSTSAKSVICVCPFMDNSIGLIPLYQFFSSCLFFTFINSSMEFSALVILLILGVLCFLF